MMGKRGSMMTKPSIAVVMGGKPESDEEETDETKASPEEVSAMKLFESATDPQEKADALKSFVKLCGGY